uniref:Integrase catalytic domain-containing protein n=1 Tax=Phytophthora fragariae TaxID=53985 RepID=A0A6A3DDX3_9STRA|nr:hypothetical protein PF009_g30454 [Phytophthora fragariae]
MHAADPNTVEWILDSGSQANVCGDLSLFTTLREDKTNKLDFANGTSEHASICGSVLLQITNLATGELEDRLLDDVVYVPSAKVNIISLGYLPTTGKFKLTCSPDQQTAWLSKPGTTLKFVMTANIYRLRVKKVTDVMVTATVKGKMDSKKSMELLHQRFGHMGMSTVKLLANKLDVGIEINAKDLSSYDCVACAAGKAKRMSYARIPVRKSKPLETLMMDICSMSEPTIDGATMFLFVIDESTRYKWTYLLKEKSDAESHVKVLLNRLARQFPGKTVLRLRSDQGGEFSSNALSEFCDTLGIEQKFTNAYSPQENGIVERANGVVLPRLRAMLTATHLPNSLWGEALLHVVATLNRLPTKPLGLVSPHQKLFKTEPALDDLRTWGCIAHVRVPPESRQRKEKLEPRARLSLLLGYSDNTIGYKFMDLVTAQVVTARGGNVTFHEEYTADGTYVQLLMLNAFADGDHKLPETVPVARIKTSMDTYLPDRTAASASATKQLDIVPPEGQPAEHVQSSVGCPQDADLPACDSVESQPAAASPADLQDPAKAPDGLAKAGAPRKRSRHKKPAAMEKETSGFAIEAPPTEPCLKRPRRKQKANVRLSDYVVGHVQATTDMQIPTTYKQARASKFWPQWRAAMLAELQSLKDHMTWRLVPRTDTKKTKVIACRWVFAVKKDERGRIKRFKARLVIHGFK